MFVGGVLCGKVGGVVGVNYFKDVIVRWVIVVGGVWIVVVIDYWCIGLIFVLLVCVWGAVEICCAVWCVVGEVFIDVVVFVGIILCGVVCFFRVWFECIGYVLF